MVYFTNKQLVEAIREVSQNEYSNYLQKYILELIELKECSPEIKRDLQMCIARFVSRLKKKQLQYRKNCDEFLLKNETWLEKQFHLPPSILSLQQSQEVQKNSVTKRGRPKISYEKSSDRTKRKKYSELSASYSSDILTAAACKSLRKEGNKQVANLISEGMSNKSVEKVSVVHPYTEEKALALIINCRLSVDQYKLLRIGAKEKGADIYPSYHKVSSVKALLSRKYSCNRDIRRSTITVFT